MPVSPPSQTEQEDRSLGSSTGPSLRGTVAPPSSPDDPQTPQTLLSLGRTLSSLNPEDQVMVSGAQLAAAKSKLLKFSRYSVLRFSEKSADDRVLSLFLDDNDNLVQATSYPQCTYGHERSRMHNQVHYLYKLFPGRRIATSNGFDTYGFQVESTALDVSTGEQIKPKKSVDHRIPYLNSRHGLYFISPRTQDIQEPGPAAAENSRRDCDHEQAQTTVPDPSKMALSIARVNVRRSDLDNCEPFAWEARYPPPHEFNGITAQDKITTTIFREIAGTSKESEAGSVAKWRKIHRLLPVFEGSHGLISGESFKPPSGWTFADIPQAVK